MQRGEGPNDVKGASLWGGGESCLTQHSHTLNLQKHFVFKWYTLFSFYVK